MKIVDCGDDGSVVMVYEIHAGIRLEFLRGEEEFVFDMRRGDAVDLVFAIQDVLDGEDDDNDDDYDGELIPA